ncbi:CPBP family intramembrane metalloprotease [Guyparkeria halophila]|uniref:CPBP family intramembrane metalloprotease n=1 Tax=Guyparkeria halophila TaxID=47960 RepID=A0A6I6D513_9GAMM|nr:CPBP family intramembrane glutamic endopeptidase [Guyparkeria halophila]QGT79367.1 CPBP family intramembrane metalloprotease [Guyparkeria halophila]
MTDLRHFSLALFAAVAAGLVTFFTGSAEPVGLAVLLPLLGLGLLAATRGAWTPMSATIAIGLGVILTLHVWPGFHNPPIWQDRHFCADCRAHSLYLSLDQALLVVAWLPLLIGRWRPTRAWNTLAAGVATITAAIALGIATGLFRWQPGWPGTSLLTMFAVANLVTVAAEELLFRGLLQRHLLRPLGPFHAWWLTALIFGLAHLPFGIEFAIVATAAGLGYGWIAWQSGSLWPAIALHWLVNLLHFSLFSYPMLA